MAVIRVIAYLPQERPSPFVDGMRVTSRAGTVGGAAPYGPPKRGGALVIGSPRPQPPTLQPSPRPTEPPMHCISARPAGTIRMGFGHHRIAYAAASWGVAWSKKSGGATYFHDLLNIESAQARLDRIALTIRARSTCNQVTITIGDAHPRDRQVVLERLATRDGDRRPSREVLGRAHEVGG